MPIYPYEEHHLKTLRQLAPECMVLLKHDGSFPLEAPGMIALYGSGARRTIKGGTGSGDVNVRHCVTVEEGLENAGFTISTKAWLDAYDQIYQQAYQDFVEGIKQKARDAGISPILMGMGAVMPEPEYDLPLEGEGETAVYVLARISGEGSDRKVQTGDFSLTQTEIHDILELSRRYARFLLVLNVGGVVDLAPVMEVKNILLLSQLGMVIGDAFSDVLLGKADPSGKLTATWASWTDYGQIGDFGMEDDTHYREGIYVGYRYFDTVGKIPLFPFGFGLSYTTFSIGTPEISLDRSKVSIRVLVTNQGNYAGKEVIQLYVSVPSDKLDQPYQTLAAFAKTAELQPGQTGEARLLFGMEELASFDAGQGSRILEAGEYRLRIGNSSRDTRICGVIQVREPICVEKLSHIEGCTGLEDWTPSLQERQADQAPLTADLPSFSLSAEDFLPKSKAPAKAKDPQLLPLLEEMSDSELAYLCLGHFQESGDGSVVGNAGTHVAGSAGETYGRYQDRGIPSLVMADGPAGLRLCRQYRKNGERVYPLTDTIPAAMVDYVDEQVLRMLFAARKAEEPQEGEICEQYCSAIPVGTALAQSFDTQLCRQCGSLVGEEMERFGIHIWLAPALNIQRSPLCGRNFEYYSEDPLVSGKMAAALTEGVQQHPGCAVSVKHFACNNQETNRYCSNSIVSERALRDVYLRGFEIVVKEAQPYTLMTSYNLLCGEHTSQRRDLLTQVLREEWGFQGVVMSDWVIPGIKTGGHRYPYACASGSIKAGNDIMMPGGEEDHQDLMDALSDPDHRYPLSRKDLMECAYRVCSLARMLAFPRQDAPCRKSFA